jgi:FkbM family methyltransferase
MTKIFWKIRLFLKSMIIVKNWRDLLSIYFEKYMNNICFLNLWNGQKLKIRATKNSSDIHVFSEIWLENAYLKNFKLKTNSTIIDIGAHIGLFSILVSNICKNGTIYAYEPEKENYNLLNTNITENNIKNINFNNLGVSSKNGMMKLYYDKNDFAGHSLYRKSERSINIKTISIDEIFLRNNLLQCDLLKLDCEGGEYDIIMNLSEEILDKINAICIEYEEIPDLKYTKKDMILKLREKFIVIDKINSEKAGYLFATKK